MSTDTTCLVAPSADAAAPSKHEEREAAQPSGSQLAGTLWFAGWLFTIGFAQLVWWKVLLALVAWPYFLGVTLR